MDTRVLFKSFSLMTDPSLTKAVQRHLTVLKTSLFEPKKFMSAAVSTLSESQLLAHIWWNFLIALTSSALVSLSVPAVFAPNLFYSVIFSFVLLMASFGLFWLFSTLILQSQGSLRRHLVAYLWWGSVFVIMSPITVLFAFMPFRFASFSTLIHLTVMAFVIIQLPNLGSLVLKANPERVKVSQIICGVLVGLLALTSLSSSLLVDGLINQQAKFFESASPEMAEAMEHAMQMDADDYYADDREFEDPLEIKKAALESRDKAPWHCAIEIDRGEGQNKESLCLQPISNTGSKTQEIQVRTICDQMKASGSAQIVKGACPLTEKTFVCRVPMGLQNDAIEYYGYDSESVGLLGLCGDSFPIVAMNE